MFFLHDFWLLEKRQADKIKYNTVCREKWYTRTKNIVILSVVCNAEDDCVAHYMWGAESTAIPNSFSMPLHSTHLSSEKCLTAQTTFDFSSMIFLHFACNSSIRYWTNNLNLRFFCTAHPVEICIIIITKCIFVKWYFRNQTHTFYKR